ncbi:MAG: GTP 3',8-cyclase MoaA [Chloroflexi bacterium]|nr:GTP 3',8-cyclase MoaA [Chloroflexota bacterium]
MLKDVFGRPLKDLRISVTDRCNFRCPYCMPAEIYGIRYRFLPKEQVLTFEEITRLARIFVGLGVNKIRLTGGEPLLRNNLEELIVQLARIEEVDDLTLTTNGYLLAQKAQALKEAGLQRVTVSLDSMDDEIFGRMNGRGYGTQRVLEGIHKAGEVGLGPIKINVVVQRGVNENTIVDLARYFKKLGHIVRFIEYMDVGNLNGWRMDQVFSADEIIETISREIQLEPLERNYKGEVALRYGYKNGGGEVGVIASVTKPFCGDCTRVRLSTDGKVYTCLFSSEGYDLKGPLRAGATDEELRSSIVGIWSRRADRYSEERASLTVKPPRKVEMYHIGG